MTKSAHSARHSCIHYPQIADVHPAHVRGQALTLVGEGLNDCQISRRLGVPRSTIRDWRRPSYVRRANIATCPRCWQRAKKMHFTPEDYAELLAIYLCDGCISSCPRTWRLRVALDTKYEGIIGAIRALLSRCFPDNDIGEVEAHGGSMVFLSLYCSHLPCLFPQHAPGQKHRRRIALERWQQELLDAAPWRFIRGCIWTDGCSFINRTNVHQPVPYEYLSFDFSNMSHDIVRLFVDACDRVRLDYRVAHQPGGPWRVRINRRASVRRVAADVGIKH
jgi:hypothetical protein